MPKVERDAELADAVRELVKAQDDNQSKAAKLLGIDRWRIRRCLNDGMILAEARDQVRQRLGDLGYLAATKHAAAAPEGGTKPQQVVALSRAVLQYLMQALDSHERRKR